MRNNREEGGQGKYWTRDGKYQELYLELWGKLVPSQGRSSSTRGELLRAVSKIYHDLHNNGGMNFDLPIFAYYLATIKEWQSEIEANAEVNEVAFDFAHHYHQLLRITVDGELVLGDDLFRDTEYLMDLVILVVDIDDQLAIHKKGVFG